MVRIQGNIYTRIRRLVVRDEGITFMEAIVTFVMLMAAAVVVTKSLFFGNRMLDVDMHKQQALRLVQSELEYWKGRLYLQSNVTSDLLTTKKDYKSVEIDVGDDWMGPPVIINLSRSSITKVDDPNMPPTQTGEAFVAYYRITVWAEWEEPDGEAFKKENGNEISLSTYVSTNGYFL